MCAIKLLVLFHLLAQRMSKGTPGSGKVRGSRDKEQNSLTPVCLQALGVWSRQCGPAPGGRQCRDRAVIWATACQEVRQAAPKILS